MSESSLMTTLVEHPTVQVDLAEHTGIPEAGVEDISRDQQGRLARHLLVAALASYVVATAVGVVMRFGFAGYGFPLPFDQLLHSHSHALYFGWAGLAVLAAVIRPIRGMQATSAALILSTPVLFFGFLAYAYNGITIAISTVIMFLWYGVIWLWWRDRTGDTSLATRTMRMALGYLVAASCGVWALAVLQASGVGTGFTEALAVHSFLIGFAWFTVLAVIGLVVGKSDDLGLVLDSVAVQRAVVWFAAIGWATVPLSVAGGAETPWIGPMARVAGVMLVYPGWLWAKTLWMSAPSGRLGRSWRLTAMWFALAATMSGGVGLLGTQALNIGTRQGVVIYLHVLFVGYVTTGLVALFGNRRTALALDVHGLALAVMVVGLVMIPMGRTGIGMDIALGGAVVLWAAGAAWAAILLRRS